MTLTVEKVATQGTWVVHNRSSSTGRFVAIKPGAGAKSKPQKNYEGAVYSYVRAVRSAGKRSVSAAEVASALEISEREARKILSNMADKGVKPR
jgi:hypothetical protein